MKLSQEQILYISSTILLTDIQTYINNHRSEYEEFLRLEDAEKQSELKPVIDDKDIIDNTYINIVLSNKKLELR